MQRAASGEGDPRGDLKLPGPIAFDITTTDIVSKKLQRRFCLTSAVAALVAELVFSESGRRP